MAPRRRNAKNSLLFWEEIKDKKLLTGVGKSDLVGFIWVDPNTSFTTLQHSSSQSFLELARATSLVSFGSIQTRPLPHFNTVAASLFWSWQERPRWFHLGRSKHVLYHTSTQ